MFNRRKLIRRLNAYIKTGTNETRRDEDEPTDICFLWRLFITEEQVLTLVIHMLCRSHFLRKFSAQVFRAVRCCSSAAK
jgi:hypothetical protein